MRNRPAALLALALLVPVLCAGQEDEGGKPRPQRYTPPSHGFYCDLPVGWEAFEEPEDAGTVSRLLGPEDPGGVFRAGIDIRWSEKGDPAYVPYKKALEELRRGDDKTSRSATGVRVMRISGALTRVFEITEIQRLPKDRWPSMPVELHRYVAIYPIGESYFTISLASTRDSYLDYRDLFVDFLKNFKPMGYK